MSTSRGLSGLINGRERRLQLVIILILISVSLFYGLYLDRPDETSSSPRVEVKGIEHDQNFDESDPSEVYIVELANGTKYHYWRTEDGIDQGYTEIDSKLNLFEGNKTDYTGLDYRPSENVCARDISRNSINLYRC